MPSTYTSNTGIEKPGSGEQSGTWGTTANINFDIIDQALHGQALISIFGDQDLTTNDGSTSDGANTVLVLTGSPGATFELRVTPTDQEKFYTIRNETNAACRVIYKGVTYSTSNGVEIAPNTSSAVTGDGGGASGVFKSVNPSTDIINDTTPQLGGNLDVNGQSIVSVSAGNINITPDTTGRVVIDGLNYPDTDGSANDVLITDGAANLSFVTPASIAFSPGMIMPYTGVVAPTGWLLCYGQAISRTTYAALYAVMQDSYGAGDGSTTFNLPDLRGRTIAGKDDMGGVSANRLTNQSGGLDGDTLGAAGGAETHTLTVPELPDSFYYNSNLNSVDDYVDNYANANFTARVADVISHTTQGGANGHNNVQPTLIFTYIVKT